MIYLKKNNNQSSKIDIKLSSKPEKIIMASALSIAGAILFDEKKKKIKHPEKYRNFFQRTKKNYKIADAMLNKTIAKDLSKRKETYNSEVLNILEIEKGELIDLK